MINYYQLDDRRTLNEGLFCRKFCINYVFKSDMDHLNCVCSKLSRIIARQPEFIPKTRLKVTFIENFRVQANFLVGTRSLLRA